MPTDESTNFQHAMSAAERANSALERIASALEPSQADDDLESLLSRVERRLGDPIPGYEAKRLAGPIRRVRKLLKVVGV